LQVGVKKFGFQVVHSPNLKLPLNLEKGYGHGIKGKMKAIRCTTLIQFVPTIFNNLNKIWKHFNISKFEIGTK
jgi:hypothetical protein